MSITKGLALVDIIQQLHTCAPACTAVSLFAWSSVIVASCHMHPVIHATHFALW